MKISAALVCLLFALTTNSCFFGLADANSVVLDTDGDKVQTGVHYYVMPATFGPGGGLALGRTPSESCPEVVVQRRSEVDFGIPVIFANVNSDDVVVSLNSDVYVEFFPIRDRLCMTSTVWTVEKLKLTTGGVRGEVGSGRSPSWFIIEEFGGAIVGYKFIHCPSGTSFPVCGNVGRFTEDGQIRLGLTDEAAQWVFIKASKIGKLAGYAKQ